MCHLFPTAIFFLKLSVIANHLSSLVLSLFTIRRHSQHNFLRILSSWPVCPQLQAICAFGTDGEKPRIDSFNHEFGFAQHLTCFIHVRRNIKEKLQSYCIPSDVAQQVMNDIFGQRRGTIFEEGIVDAVDTDDFQHKLESLETKWRNLDTSSSSDLEGFLHWFTINKIDVPRNTMLRPVREECGLGCPSAIFTTNASKSSNVVLKRKVDYKKSELPVFIKKIKELVSEQQKEVERAIVCRGKYQFHPQYKYLQVPENKWFSMTTQQRTKYLSKIQSLSVTDVQDSCQGSSECSSIIHSLTTPESSSSRISVSVESAAESINVPLTCLEGIWKKAADLLMDQTAMAPAPGQSIEAKMVLSHSGNAPHLVTPQKKDSFSCDSRCPNWKSLSLCAHTVAVAEAYGKLQQFIVFLQKKKRPPNLTKLVTSSMPQGRGRKGSAPPHKS